MVNFILNKFHHIFKELRFFETFYQCPQPLQSYVKCNGIQFKLNLEREYDNLMSRLQALLGFWNNISVNIDQN